MTYGFGTIPMRSEWLKSLHYERWQCESSSGTGRFNYNYLICMTVDLETLGSISVPSLTRAATQHRRKRGRPNVKY